MPRSSDSHRHRNVKLLAFTELVREQTLQASGATGLVSVWPHPAQPLLLPVEKQPKHLYWRLQYHCLCWAPDFGNWQWLWPGSLLSYGIPPLILFLFFGVKSVRLPLKQHNLSSALPMTPASFHTHGAENNIHREPFPFPASSFLKSPPWQSVSPWPSLNDGVLPFITTPPPPGPSFPQKCASTINYKGLLLSYLGIFLMDFNCTLES